MSRSVISKFALHTTRCQTDGMCPLSPGETRPTRRTRLRRATVDQIKTLARRQLADGGPSALSLRAIAREMGTASSALYRYFASYDELIGALCADAYDAVADALAAARDTRPETDHAGRLWEVSRSFRQWSLDNGADFALIFGTPVPGYRASEQVTGPAAGRFTAIPLELYAAAVGAGAADPGRTQVPADVTLGADYHALLAGVPPDYPPALVAIVLTASASVRGYITMEVFGSLNRLLGDTDKLFDGHLRTVMLGMGFRPDLVKAAAHPDRT